MRIIVAGIGIRSELSKDDADKNLRMVAGKDGVISKYADFKELSSQLSNLMRKVCRK